MLALPQIKKLLEVPLRKYYIIYMEIIIGREEGTRRLHCVADGREFNVGQTGSVPLSVSRRHCKLTILEGRITIENMKLQNATFVDGNQVFSKEINTNSKVQLGVERYTIPLQQILSLVTGNVQSAAAFKQVSTFSLLPLKSIWEEYDERRLAIQENAAKNANRQRLQGILSLLGMCVGFIPGISSEARVFFVVAALAIALYFFFKGCGGQTVQRQLHDLDDEFAKRYKCPNPKCGRTFGSIPYRQIEYTPKCMSCGCNYTH